MKIEDLKAEFDNDRLIDNEMELLNSDEDDEILDSILDEVLDNPYEFSVKRHDGKRSYFFSTDDTKYEMVLSPLSTSDVVKEFLPQKAHDIIGDDVYKTFVLKFMLEGDVLSSKSILGNERERAVRIFSTIINILKEVEFENLVFYTRKDQPSRNRLYAAIAKKLNCPVLFNDGTWVLVEHPVK
jgi:hypothetical protein